MNGGILILHGPNAGLYPAYDFGIGLGGVSGSVSVEAVKLYYSGDAEKMTKDVFFGNRVEFNFGADFLGHVGLTSCYAKLADGNSITGVGASLGFGFSAFILSGNVNSGRTQTSGKI